jgi:hypothetical protein
MNASRPAAAAVVSLVAAVLIYQRVQHDRATGRFADVQRRGAGVMGVDQYSSAHVFEDLPTGGRVVLDRDDPSDSAGIAKIRGHMREIADAFRAGDFSKPFAVHAETVPGTAVMAAHGANISYRARDRDRGAEVDIQTTDSAAAAAIHEFLAFQRQDHRAAAHEHMPGMTMP